MKPTNKHVLVTRPAHQATALCEQLRAAGYQAISFPTIEIVPVTLSSEKLKQLNDIQGVDIVIFISANAVHHANKHKTAWQNSTCYVAIGPATADAMESVGITPTLIASKPFNSEQLVKQLSTHFPRGKTLIIKGRDGRQFLAQALIENDFQVDSIDVYERLVPSSSSNSIVSKDIHYITITSQLALKNLQILLGKTFLALAKRCVFIVLSHRIEQFAKEMGCQHIIVSYSANNDGLVQAIKQSEGF